MPIQLTIKPRGADLCRQGLEDLSREVPLISRKRIYEALKRAQAILKIAKSRPRSPIQWDSERQKRAFFASDGFSRGIPTSRTGRSLRWELVNVGNGYRLSDPADYARYLYGYHDGSGQSRIFSGTYPLFRDVVENQIKDLPQDIEQHITYRSRGAGF